MATVIGQAISNIGQSLAGNIPRTFWPQTPSPAPTSVGVQAKAPVTTTQSNTLPTGQAKAPSTGSSFSSSTLAQQQALNNANKNTPGYVPLVTDGIMGPKTQAAINQYGGSSQTQQKAPTTQATSQTQPPQNNNGLYGQLVNNLSNQGTSQYQNAASNAREQLQNLSTDTNDIDLARKNLTKQIGIDTDAQAAIRNQAIPLEFQQGRGQVLQQAQLQKEGQLQGILGNLLTQRAQQQSGLASAAGIAGNQQSQQQGAIGSAAGLAAPQFPSYTSAQFNPVTGDYGTVGGGKYGSGPAAVSNIQSIQDAQTAYNNIQRDVPAIDNQFSAIANYAQQAGLTGNSPILAGFQNRFGTNFATNPAVIGFNQAISSLNQLLQAQGEAPIDPHTATMQTIQQAQQTVKSNLARKQSSYQNYLNSGSTSSTGSTGSTGAANPWR